MATPTYTLIDSVTLSSAASSVTFSSIPAGGDLVLVVDNNGDRQQGRVRFNGDTGSNYSYVGIYGGVAAPTSGKGTTTYVFSMLTASAQNAIHQVMDYSATDKHKTVLSRGGTTTESVVASASRWANTSAITSLTYSAGGSFPNGATLHLYDIAKA